MTVGGGDINPSSSPELPSAAVTRQNSRRTKVCQATNTEGKELNWREAEFPVDGPKTNCYLRNVRVHIPRDCEAGMLSSIMLYWR